MGDMFSLFHLLLLLLLLKFISKTEGTSNICCRHSNGLLHPPTRDEMEALDRIERIPCDSISVETFRERYEDPGRPVILVGCDKNWPAREKWTFKNLAGRFASDDDWRLVFLENNTHNPDNDDDRVLWSTIVDAMEKNIQFYVFDNLNTTFGKTLEEDYEVPPFFRHDQFQHFTNFPKDYGPMRWFALGSKNTGTFTHVDPFETDAWNTVVHGMKWWMFFPLNSVQGRDEYDEDYDNIGCDPECSEEDLSIDEYFRALWSSPSKDLFDGNGIRHVFQKEGETLYVPIGMIHSVLNVEDTVAITANYASPRRIPIVWDTFMTFDADPEELERYYCDILSKSQRNELVDYSYSCDFKNDDEF